MAKEKKEKKERKEKKEKKKVSEESIEPVSGEKQKQNDDSFNVLTEMTAVALDNGNEPTEKKKKSKKTMTEEEKEEQRRINRESREKKKLKKELNKKRKRGELVEEEEEEKEAVKADDDQNDTTTEEERKIKKPKTEKKEKEPEYGVWVGNLAFSTTTDTIKDFFKDCGKVKRMRCPKGNGVKNNNKGFAYVFFSTSEEQAKAIAKSEQELEGRALLIKAEDNFERADGIKPPTEKEKKEIKKQKNPPCPTLFLGNLSFEATEQSIREAFEWAGDIRKVRVATFEDSGKCKGFAYVDYFTVESATKAIRAPDKHVLDGRKCRVEFASEEAHRRSKPWLLRQQKRGPPNKEQTNEPSEPAMRPRKTDREERAERIERKESQPEKKPKNERVKPGEALYSAQRQKPTVQEFKGKKTVFE